MQRLEAILMTALLLTFGIPVCWFLFSTRYVPVFETSSHSDTFHFVETPDGIELIGSGSRNATYIRDWMREVERIHARPAIYGEVDLSIAIQREGIGFRARRQRRRPIPMSTEFSRNQSVHIVARAASGNLAWTYRSGSTAIVQPPAASSSASAHFDPDAQTQRLLNTLSDFAAARTDLMTVAPLIRQGGGAAIVLSSDADRHKRFLRRGIVISLAASALCGFIFVLCLLKYLDLANAARQAEDSTNNPPTPG